MSFINPTEIKKLNFIGMDTADYSSVQITTETAFQTVLIPAYLVTKGLLVISTMMTKDRGTETPTFRLRAGTSTTPANNPIIKTFQSTTLLANSYTTGFSFAHYFEGLEWSKTNYVYMTLECTGNGCYCYSVSCIVLGQ